MKRIYKQIEVASSEILLTIALLSNVDGMESLNAVKAEFLGAQLSRPNYTGAEQLPAAANVQRSHLEITRDGKILAILHRLERGANRFVCKARYGTNISVQLTIDFVVTNPNETTPVEMSEDVVLVKSIGDGGGGGADATVYALDGNGNANITKPLTVSGSVQEGDITTASGANSHAEGRLTNAKGNASHAEGGGTIAAGNYQHVCGQYNVEDTDNSFLFIVGNGTGSANRHNAFAVTRSGELALFAEDGTPVILDANTLKDIIALV